jgi:ribonucleoside-diphosphate reductase beta chain
MRDESLHLAFGCDLINTIKSENPQVWETPGFQKEIIWLIREAVELEKEYACEACPEGIVGINSQQFCEYVEYIANRRLERIGLNKIYFKDQEKKIEVENPFDWMSASTDLNKKKDFFSTRVTEYQIGGRLEWDED